MKDAEVSINIGDSIGYIIRAIEPKGFFLREAKVASIRISKLGVRVYAPKRFRPLDMDEIKLNTSILLKNKNLILVQEPFLLTDELRERVERWCKFAAENPDEVKSVFEQEKNNG